mgnify:CR=1 FL=1
MARQSKPVQPPTMDDVMAYLQAQSGPVGKRDLARAFGAKGDDRIHIKNLVRDMQRKGLIHTARQGRQIGIAGALPDRVIAEITGFDSLGDLVARPSEWLEETPAPRIIITKDTLSPPAGIGDVVQVGVKPAGSGLYHGTALRRVSTGGNQIVGVYQDGQISSADRRLKQSFTLVGIPRTCTLKDGDLVLADIPFIRERLPQATFVKKIGSMADPFAPTLIAIYMHRLPTVFTPAAVKQADQGTVPPPNQHREDLRSVPFITIDGADARDFDDAVWAEPDTRADNPGGWHLMIGIADVAWYVRPDTPLDTEARRRGNSVYFPDQVIPMLPTALSNGVCSLKPNEPRAALVCEVWITRTGIKKRHIFRRAIIQSARRLTYDEVQDALDGKTPIVGLEPEIAHLAGAYRSLKTARDKRGVLELDVPEKQIILDKAGRVHDVRLRIQTDSMRLIEEMMILANVSAAETLEEKGVPVMYRVHDQPSADKVENLTAFLSGMGVQTNWKDAPTPETFNALLARVKQSPDDRAVNEMVLRAQSQACYAPENIGHFGLALARYAHFTSPIRRYADILVHRALIRALKLGEDGLTPAEEKTFAETARHISHTERQAAAAEMDADDRYMATYLQDKIGQAFEARISSITAFGLFLTLEPYGADAFVPMRRLGGDFYDYDPDTLTLTGRGTGISYRIGDRVQAVLRECEPVTGGLLCTLLSGKAPSRTVQNGTKPPHKKRKSTRRSPKRSRRKH